MTSAPVAVAAVRLPPEGKTWRRDGSSPAKACGRRENEALPPTLVVDAVWQRRHRPDGAAGPSGNAPRLDRVDPATTACDRRGWRCRVARVPRWLARDGGRVVRRAGSRPGNVPR